MPLTGGDGIVGGGGSFSPLFLAQAGMGFMQNQMNAANVNAANLGSLKFNYDMYMRQRHDALKDRDYNSPVNQMKRLKEAGLNPNLIYGSGAGSTQATIRSSSPGSYRQEAPQVSGMDTLIPMVLNIIKTQADTTRIEAATRLSGITADFAEDSYYERLRQNDARTNIMLNENDLKAAQVLKTDLDAAFTKQKIDLDQKLTSANIEFIKQKLLLAVEQTSLTKEMQDLVKQRIKMAEFETQMNDVLLKGGSVSDLLKLTIQGIFKWLTK